MCMGDRACQFGGETGVGIYLKVIFVSDVEHCKYSAIAEVWIK